MLFDLEVAHVEQRTSEEDVAENTDLDAPVAALPLASRPLPFADISEAGTGASDALTALASQVALLLEGRNRSTPGLAHDVAPVADLAQAGIGASDELIASLVARVAQLEDRTRTPPGPPPGLELPASSASSDFGMSIGQRSGPNKISGNH